MPFAAEIADAIRELAKNYEQQGVTIEEQFPLQRARYLIIIDQDERPMVVSPRKFVREGAIPIVISERDDARQWLAGLGYGENFISRMGESYNPQNQAPDEIANGVLGMLGLEGIVTAEQAENPVQGHVPYQHTFHLSPA